ncbi:MAG: Hsp20/alpha crystallin family protein [Desulfobacterales bacterium]|nr:Hsp20/alpha crystallin family protein [Desulfobacterales bacterium]
MSSYIKIKFGDDVPEINSNFGRTIEEIFRSMGPFFTCSECLWKPPMDIYETPEEIIIIAEIAGVNKENLEIEISGKAARIFGKRDISLPVENPTYRLAEIQYGTFERILFLPSPIDTEKVTASFTNGFLQIRLTKAPPEKPHKIQIK